MKVAIVIPWFGESLKGGAEQQAWQIASRLTKKNIHVTVLTTCSKEFLSNWSENYYEAGNYIEDNIEIKRFSVRNRNRKLFDKVNLKLMTFPKTNFISGISPISDKEENIYLNENIYSPNLQLYLEKNKNNYDLFIFLPYLFPNIIKGVEAVGEKSILQPCLHNESYAYLNCVASMFYSAHRLFFNSEGELELAKVIYGCSILPKIEVVYEGIETICYDHITYDKYILSLGRRDKGKNTHLLIESFDQFIKKTKSDLKLLIAGVGDLPISPKSNNIIDLGMVNNSEKLKLIANCLALINPSENESFSRVIFEAWYAKKPIIIHKNCLATYEALKSSGMAGFFAYDIDSFINTFIEIEQIPLEKIKQIGTKGYEYANRIADWDKVIARYLSSFERLKNSNKVKKYNNKSIHQLLPNLSYGDAISNQAIAIKKILIEEGYESKIFVRHIDPKVASECEKFKPKKLNKDDGLIYHHSIGFEYTEYAIKHNGKKALIYHNITPKDFFEPYNKKFAKLLQTGREHLHDLAGTFPFNYGDSQFNVNELILNGCKNCDVLPLIISPDKWNFLPDSSVIQDLTDGKKNILFTGRLAPNKKQTDLVKMMFYLKQINRNVRLCIVGTANLAEPYVMELYDLIKKYDLMDDVIVTGRINEATLKAYYMSADLYVSMSEHEGFGVPLIEAMWFDIPVLAFESSAIPETLAGSGFMFKNKKDMLSVAVLTNELLNNKELRKNIIFEQQKVRENYSFQQVKHHYIDLIGNIS